MNVNDTLNEIDAILQVAARNGEIYGKWRDEIELRVLQLREVKAMERYDLVERAYNELVASGVVHDSMIEAELEAMKGAVTFRAAYYVNKVNPNRGLLAKTSGNNVKGFKADVIMDKDGTTFDISTDNGKKIIIQNPSGKSEPELKDLWRQPTAELAGLTDEPPVDNGGNTTEVTALVKKVIEMQQNISNAQVQILDAQTHILQILQTILDKPIEIPPVQFPDYESNRIPILGTITFKPKK